MCTLIWKGIGAFISVRIGFSSLSAKFFPDSTWGIQNMVDKSFLCRELFDLRRPFWNLPIFGLYSYWILTLCSVLFVMDLYKRWACLFFGPWILARQAYLTRPVGPCFYPLQLPPSPHLVRRYLRKGANWGDSQINTCWWFDVRGLTVEI